MSVRVMSRGAARLERETIRARIVLSRKVFVRCDEGRIYSDGTPCPPWRIGKPTLGVFLEIIGEGSTFEEALQRACERLGVEP